MEIYLSGKVIALQAIFGDDMVILENKDNLRFIQVT